MNFLANPVVLCSSLELFFFFIGVEWLYNVVLTSAGQWPESAVCMHVAPPLGSPFRLHSIHRSPQSTRLSSLCYSQSPLASVHTWQCTHVSPSLPVNPTITSPRPLSTCLFLCLHLCSGRVNRFIYAIFLDSTYMCEYTVFVFLTYFTLYDIL